MRIIETLPIVQNGWFVCVVGSLGLFVCGSEWLFSVKLIDSTPFCASNSAPFYQKYTLSQRGGCGEKREEK
jgi:hypothetical protein